MTFTTPISRGRSSGRANLPQRRTPVRRTLQERPRPARRPSGRWAYCPRQAAWASAAACPKAIDTVAVTRPPELRNPHMIFIDNVLGNYFRPEGGGLTLHRNLAQ